MNSPDRGDALLQKLGPGERRLLAIVRELAEYPPTAVYLVGGPVRDLLLGCETHDLDLVVVGDGPAFAERLARRLGGSLRVFTRFGTAVVGARGHGHVDVTSARSESYPQPGALPEVRRGATLEEDLRRRDFTLNALAIGLGPGDYGRLYDPLGGERDLRARRLRVVHEQSFRDDPNRLIRAAAFAGRFGFALERRTERLLREAVAARALGTISADRRNDTLRRLLEKPGAARGIELLNEWGALEQVALGPQLGEADCARLERVPEALRALGETESGRHAAQAYVALLLARPGVEAEVQARALGLGRRGCGEMLRAVAAVRRPPAALRARQTEAAAVYLALEGLEAGGLAALWTGEEARGRARIENYWRRLRQVCPDVRGEELEARGMAGAAIAAGLRRALLLKLAEPEASREEQLRAALHRG